MGQVTELIEDQKVAILVRPQQARPLPGCLSDYAEVPGSQLFATATVTNTRGLQRITAPPPFARFSRRFQSGLLDLGQLS